MKGLSCCWKCLGLVLSWLPIFHHVWPCFLASLTYHILLSTPCLFGCFCCFVVGLFAPFFLFVFVLFSQNPLPVTEVTDTVLQNVKSQGQSTSQSPEALKNKLFFLLLLLLFDLFVSSSPPPPLPHLSLSI